VNVLSIDSIVNHDLEDIKKFSSGKDVLAEIKRKTYENFQILREKRLCGDMTTTTNKRIQWNDMNVRAPPMTKHGYRSKFEKIEKRLSKKFKVYVTHKTLVSEQTKVSTQAGYNKSHKRTCEEIKALIVYFENLITEIKSADTLTIEEKSELILFARPLHHQFLLFKIESIPKKENRKRGIEIPECIKLLRQKK